MSRVPSSRRYRGAFRIGLGISALLHLGALLLYPRLLERIPEGPFPAGFAPAPLPAGGVELLNLLELTPEEELEILLETPPPEETLRPAAAPSPSPLGPRPGEAEPSPTAPPPLSAAERLRPREGDPRLWRPVDPRLLDLTEEERLRLRLVAELELLNDSMADEAERLRRLYDWTYTDEEGRRWGISPGKIHLGGVTLPLPFGLAAPVNPGAAPVWQWDEIDRSAAGAAARQTQRERAQAIRQRREAERRPDTTGAHR